MQPRFKILALAKQFQDHALERAKAYGYDITGWQRIEPRVLLASTQFFRASRSGSAELRTSGCGSSVANGLLRGFPDGSAGARPVSVTTSLFSPRAK
jgi:hypothetical protein